MYLKRRMKELNIAGAGRPVLPHEVPVPADLHERTDLRGLPGGHVVPDVTPENAERIIQEHLIGGRVVEELCFARNPLG